MYACVYVCVFKEKRNTCTVEPFNKGASILSLVERVSLFIRGSTVHVRSKLIYTILMFYYIKHKDGIF